MASAYTLPPQHNEVEVSLLWKASLHVWGPPLSLSLHCCSLLISSGRPPHTAGRLDYGASRRDKKGTPPIAGATGLENLGNTCFMNSMLQCLSNTESMTKYFLSRQFEKDINKGNVLGMGVRLPPQHPLYDPINQPLTFLLWAYTGSAGRVLCGPASAAVVRRAQVCVPHRVQAANRQVCPSVCRL